MPFTLAHPALVLPFVKKKYFSATAIIMGSMSPDFEYFFKASVSGVHGHSLAGLFYFDLPVTILFSLVFHLLIKDNLMANLPFFLQRKFVTVLQFDFNKYLMGNYSVVVFSALLGAASHVFWDSFTHNGAFFVEYFEVYRHVVVPFQGVRYPLFYGLQHISTFAGLSVLLAYVYFMPVDWSFVTNRPRIRYWLLLALISSSLFILRFAFLPEQFNLGNAVVTGISSLILSLGILGFVKSFRPVTSTRN